jgi:hypothetical protein
MRLNRYITYLEPFSEAVQDQVVPLKNRKSTKYRRQDSKSCNLIGGSFCVPQPET